MDEELSVKEAADLLKVSHTAILKMVERGELVPSREEMRGQQHRRWFRRSDVEQVRQPPRSEVV